MVKKNKKTGKIKGYGFLVLKSRKEFEEMVKQKTYKVLDRILFVKPYYTGEELKKFKIETEKKRIFLHPLPLHFNDNDLYIALAEFGKVEDAFVARDVRNENTSKGFGYATFEEVEYAERALQKAKVEYGGFEIGIEKYRRRGKLKKNANEGDSSNKSVEAEDKVQEERGNDDKKLENVEESGQRIIGNYVEENIPYYRQRELIDQGQNDSHRRDPTSSISNQALTEPKKTQEPHKKKSERQIQERSMSNSFPVQRENFYPQNQRFQQQHQRYIDNSAPVQLNQFQQEEYQRYNEQRGLFERRYRNWGYGDQIQEDLPRRTQRGVRIRSNNDSVFIESVEFNHSPDNIKFNKKEEG